MIAKVGNILTGSQDAILQSIKKTQGIIDKVQLTLASGKDVNSALDNPQNFFTAQALTNQAQDLRSLLDDIAASIRTIQTADIGAEGILQLIDLADALLDEALKELYAGSEETLISELSDGAIVAILNANPGVVYSTDSQSFYQRVTTNANWTTADLNARSATLVEPSSVTGVAGVTGHLAVITSQEENDFLNALSPTNTWIGGSDQAVEGEWRWVGGPEDGQQFWQGAVGGTAVNGLYENWRLGGEPNNSGNEDAVHLRPDGLWNDQGVSTAYDYIIEWDSSLFVSDADADLVTRAQEYQSDYLDIMEQIDLLARDTQFRGLGLLNSEDLRTDFNPARTSFLISEGIDATSLGLGLANNNFLTLAGLNAAREEIDEAREIMRSYSGSLKLDLGIIRNRLDFTRTSINTHSSGSDDLIVADQNEKGAELLALQTRQQLQFEALRLSSVEPIADLL